MPRITDGEYEKFCNLQAQITEMTKLLQKAADFIDQRGSDASEAERNLLARIDKAL